MGPYKCAVRAYLALPQSNCPKNAINTGGPYRASACSALTTHGVRTEQHPTAAEKNVRSPHLHGEHRTHLQRTVCTLTNT